MGYGCSLLLGESLVEQPDDDGEVLALVEGGEEHRVLVLDGHCCCCEKVRVIKGVSIVGVEVNRV